MKNIEYLPVKKIKYFLEEFLISQGWTHEPAGTAVNRDTDIDMKRGDERWIIEMESPFSLTGLITNSFVSVLGRILQRMDDKNCKYSVALPDIKPFHRLWERLPELAKSKIGITALFVDEMGMVTEVENKNTVVLL